MDVGRKTCRRSALQVDRVTMNCSGPYLTELTAHPERAASPQPVRKAPGRFFSFLASQGLCIIRHWR